MSEKNKQDGLTEEENLTKEEENSQLRMNEKDILAGLLDAADIGQDIQKIEIARNGRVYFSFRIRALMEEEYTRCRKKHTTYKRNRQMGVKMPDEVNSARFRCALIYTATVEEDRARVWDNKDAWKAMSARGQEVVTGLDMIELCLRAGEKDRVIEAIDALSGFSDEEVQEETAKN